LIESYGEFYVKTIVPGSQTLGFEAFPQQNRESLSLRVTGFRGIYGSTSCRSEDFYQDSWQVELHVNATPLNSIYLFEEIY